MQTQKILVILLVLLYPLFSFSQGGDLYIVNIKGKIISADNKEPIPFAHIINPRVHGGTTSNADGFFSLQILTEDTLTIKAVGFVDEKFHITEFPPKNLYEIVLKPVRVLIGEVTVTENLNMRNRLGLPNAEPLNIPIELRGDAFNEKPPWYAAFLSPLSFMQYHLSDREKEKREALKIIQNNEEWIQFSTFHNVENIKRLTGLQEEEADQFMLYCNLNNRLPYFASQLEIEFQIMDLYFKYLKEKDASNIAPKTK